MKTLIKWASAALIMLTTPASAQQRDHTVFNAAEAALLAVI